MLSARPGVRPADRTSVVPQAVLNVEYLARAGEAVLQCLAHRVAVGAEHPLAENRAVRRPARRERRGDVQPQQVSMEGTERPLCPEAQLPCHHPRRFQRQLEAVALS